VWLEVVQKAGIAVEGEGLAVIAQRPEAMTLLEAFRDTDMGAECTLLSEAETRGRLDGLLSGKKITGALWSPHERRIESRHAIPKLAAYLAAQDNVTFFRPVLAKDIQPGKVVTTAGVLTGERIVVCPGDDLLTLFADRIKAMGIMRCRLQMLKVVPSESSFRLTCAVMSDLSLVRYLGYSELPQAAALKQRLLDEQPRHLANGIHLIAVPGSDGLVVGDSHHYEWSVAPFASEEVDDLILDELRQVLNLPDARVSERWVGTYASLDDRLAVTDAPDPSIRLVIVTSGTGASTSFAIGEETINELFGEP